jgi:hypothetical protein
MAESEIMLRLLDVRVYIHTAIYTIDMGAGSGSGGQGYTTRSNACIFVDQYIERVGQENAIWHIIVQCNVSDELAT